MLNAFAFRAMHGDPSDFNQLHGVWNGEVKGSQPLHQLIPMATRSSTRHRLIWFSPQLVELVLQNPLGILGHLLADFCV
jgi:hypothetical protein